MFADAIWIKSLQNPEDQPEFPKIERNYFVQFMFLQDTSPKPEVLHISHENMDSAMSRLSTLDQSQGSQKVVIYTYFLYETKW